MVNQINIKRKKVSALALALSIAALPTTVLAQLEEVVVTAERRSADLQDVAIAVTAFNEESFTRLQADSLVDLHLKAPNVTIVNNTGTTNAAQIYIRGIGRDDATWNVEGGVAVYIDGVYLPQQQGALLDLIEFERVEILRGPQGTLYGRAATGGSISFVTKRPDLEKITAKGDFTIGSFERQDVRGSVSMPLIEGELASKFDFVSRSSDGFIKDVDSAATYNGTDRQTARLSVLWSPNEELDVFVAADITRDRSQISVPTPTRLDTGGFGTFNDPDGDGIGATAFGDNFIANPGINDIVIYDGDGIMAKINWALGTGTLSSTTAYRSQGYQNEGDLDGQTLLPLDFLQDIESAAFQQEIQFTSNNEGNFQYVVGASFLTEETEADSTNFFNGFSSLSEQDTDSVSVYVEGIWSAVDWLSITGGVRWSEDDKDVTQSGFSISEGPGGASSFDVAVSDSFGAVTPKFVIEARPTDDVLIYAQYQEGYKTGGIANGRPTSAANAATFFEEEISESAEIGVKAEFFNNRLRTNVAYFSMSQDDLAATVLDSVTNEINVVTADAEMDGIELEISASVTENLYLFATLATLNDKIVRAESGTGFTPGVSELKHKPDSHYVLGGEYVFQLSNGGSLGFGATYSHSDAIFRNVANTPNAQTPETDILDARIFYNSADDKWGLELAGKNLTNETYWTQAISTFGRYYAPEATWSLTLKAAF